MIFIRLKGTIWSLVLSELNHNNTKCWYETTVKNITILSWKSHISKVKTTFFWNETDLTSLSRTKRGMCFFFCCCCLFFFFFSRKVKYTQLTTLTHVHIVTDIETSREEKLGNTNACFEWFCFIFFFAFVLSLCRCSLQFSSALCAFYNRLPHSFLFGSGETAV